MKTLEKKPLHGMEVSVECYTKQCPYIPEHKRGKFLGMCDKFMINHLKSLGVNYIQIMPVMKNKNTLWGYDTVSWTEHRPEYGTEKQLKHMVKTLQDNGIKVVFDIVLNHLAEHIKGVKYYDWNVTGCENTIDVRNSLPVILPAMRYWLREIGGDGFRYDLAGVLGREGGQFKKDAEFFKLVEEEFSDKIHIAEPYDLGDDNFGMFPEHWYELNHHARDTIRSGFPYRGTSAIKEERAIGYVTVHDGFTLNDLTEYNKKHNWANGEGNKDGNDSNKSYNHGVEGPTDNVAILEARKDHREGMITNLRSNCKNWLLLEGDELCNSKHGNNNTYRYGNQISWVDWSRYEEFFGKENK